MLLKFGEKILEIHKLSWLLIPWIFKKLNSIQILLEDIPEFKLSHWYLLSKTYKKSHSKTRTLIVLNKFVCYPKSRLFILQILSYWESTVIASISSLIYKMLFYFSWLSIIQIQFWNLLTVLTVKNSNTKQSVEFLYSRSKSHPNFAP